MKSVVRKAISPTGNCYKIQSIYVTAYKGIGVFLFHFYSNTKSKESIGNIVNNTVVTMYGVRWVLDPLRLSLYKSYKRLITMWNT